MLRQGPFVGRLDHLADIRASVRDLVEGRGGLLWLQGEPGIGKSALLTAGLADATVGCAVHRAAADDIGAPFPLRLLLDALEVGPGSVDPDRMAIARLLWGQDGPQPTTGTDIVSAAAEHVVVLLERACAVTPVVLVGDDLQWADPTSVMVWGRLARLTGQMPLLLIAAARPVPHRDDIVALQRQVARLGGKVLTLDALDDSRVTELVGQLVRATPGPTLLRWAAQAGGNPLYVRELVDSLLREGRVDLRGEVADVVASPSEHPVTLQAAIADRLAFLSKPAIRLLRLATLLGPDFAVADLVIVAGEPATVLASLIDEAIAAGVVEANGSRLRFRHGLIHQALYDAMPAGLRSALHREAAQSLADAGAPADQVARQLLGAVDAADPWVVDWLATAVSKLAYRAPELALTLVERVREHATSVQQQDALDAGLVGVLRQLGRYGEVEQWARPVLLRTMDPAVGARMAWILTVTLNSMMRHAEALTVVEQAIDRWGMDRVWLARLQAQHSLTMIHLGRLDEASAMATRAEAEGTAAGDPVAVAYAIASQVQLAEVRGPTNDSTSVEEAVLELVDRALAAIGTGPEVDNIRLLLLSTRCAQLSQLGRQAEAEHALGEAAALAEQTGARPGPRAGILFATATQAFLTGRWDDALVGLEAGAELLPPNPRLRLHFNGVPALIALHRDDRDGLAQQLASVDVDSLAAYHDTMGEALLVLAPRALSAERGGDTAQALRMLLAAYDPESSGEFAALRDGRTFLWLPDLIRLAVSVGDHDTARMVLDACLARAGRIGNTFYRAVVEHCRGLVAGDPTAVVAAAEDYQRAGMPLYQAQALENAALLLAERDLAAGRAAYLRAVAIYEELGAAWDLMRADARMRPLGLRRGPTQPHRRATSGWEALTTTEVSVAHMVAKGQSNPDIAAELFISRRTVETHISHIMTKLGRRSRTEIAIEASRRP